MTFLLVILIGCNDDLQKSYEAKPAALGRLNEIVLLTDKDLQSSIVRDTFDYYFGSAFPIMPSPEPMFDIRYFSILALEAEPLRKELRTYVLLADISNLDSKATQMLRKDLGEEKFRQAKEGLLQSSVGRDKWARNQIIVYLFADGQKALSKLIADKYAAVAQRINSHDELQLETSIYAIRSDNPGLSRKIDDNLGISIKVPGDFVVAMEDFDEGFIWLRKDAKDAILNLTISTYPYTGPDMLTKDAIADLRDAYGKKYVDGTTPGSYMITNRDDLPTYSSVTSVDEQYAVEVRGIWELTEDFVAGPYISLAIVDEGRSKLILLDGFVYAPGKAKRNYIQQLAFLMTNSMVSDPSE